MDVKTRSRCQRCRYNRCLQAGMKAEYVLNESERKKRFRNSNSSSANQSVIQIEKKRDESDNQFDRERERELQLSLKHQSLIPYIFLGTRTILLKVSLFRGNVRHLLLLRRRRQFQFLSPPRSFLSAGEEKEDGGDGTVAATALCLS